MIDLYCAPVSSPRARHAVGEQLLRREAAQRLGIAQDAVSITRGAYGKPEIPGLCCNLSHSGELAVCAFASCPVGVDIERISAARVRVAERAFHPEERARLHAAAPDARDRLFFEIWTRKEAFLKCSGRGITRDLAALNVFALDPRLFHVGTMGDYCLAVCTARPEALGACTCSINWRA